jgi:hypothetical protein
MILVPSALPLPYVGIPHNISSAEIAFFIFVILALLVLVTRLVYLLLPVGVVAVAIYLILHYFFGLH